MTGVQTCALPILGELDIPEDMLIAMIVRDDETVIPNGQTVLKENDIIVMYR